MQLLLLVLLVCAAPRPRPRQPRSPYLAAHPKNLHLTLRAVSWSVVVSHGAVVNVAIALLACTAPLLFSFVEAVIWLYQRPRKREARARRARRAQRQLN